MADSNFIQMELFEKSKSESIKLDVLLIKQLYSLSVLNASPHSREAFIEIEESFKYATYCWHVNLFMKAIRMYNKFKYISNKQLYDSSLKAFT